MKTMHVVGGSVALGLGVLGVYDEYFVVVEFFKGALQPILAVAGLISILYGLLGDRPRMIHVAGGLITLGIGIYGFFDEYYATLDFIKGALPIVLLLLGTVSVVSGLRQMKIGGPAAEGEPGARDQEVES